jgi:arylsulfatase A-like enzyme
MYTVRTTKRHVKPKRHPFSFDPEMITAKPMTRKALCWIAVFLPTFAGPATLVAAAGPARPNIVVILADDLGYGDLESAGNRQIKTPHIDSIAAAGVRCTNAYVTCPVCSPTRAALLTGRYQQRFGHEFNPAKLVNDGAGQGLATDEKTIADRMRAAGYVTALVGKWHQGEEPQFWPNARGFDEFFGFPLGWHSFVTGNDPEAGPLFHNRDQVPLNQYLTRELADETCRLIETNRERPFFIYLSFNAVHTPLEAPETTLAKFADVADPIRRTYLAMLAELDDAVGRVLTKLRTEKVEENTLVLFLSDNGGPTTKYSPNGATNGPLRGSKGDTWEGGIRVPLVAQWKGRLSAGKVYEQPVSSLDVTATALAAAGAIQSSDKPLDGVDLMPIWEGRNAAAPHEFLYWRFGRQMAIRSGDWKLVRPSMSTAEYADIATEPLLFNLRDDLGEQRDLAASRPEKVRELQAAWDKWNAAMMPPKWPATLKGKVFPGEP